MKKKFIYINKKEKNKTNKQTVKNLLYWIVNLPTRKRQAALYM